MEMFKQKEFTLDMGFPLDDFIKRLFDQGKFVCRQEANLINIDYQGESLQLTLGKQRLRRVLSEQQAILPIHFNFSNMSQAKQAQFMDIFMLKFQRGGG